MNDQNVTRDERELEMQEAEARQHRAALLFADSVRLDMLLDDDDDDDLDEQELYGAPVTGE